MWKRLVVTDNDEDVGAPDFALDGGSREEKQKGSHSQDSWFFMSWHALGY